MDWQSAETIPKDGTEMTAEIVRPLSFRGISLEEFMARNGAASTADVAEQFGFSLAEARRRLRQAGFVSRRQSYAVRTRGGQGGVELVWMKPT